MPASREGPAPAPAGAPPGADRPFHPGGIRGRILGIALAPALLTAVALAGAYIHQSLEASEAQLYAQGRLAADHLAKLAEFDLFVGNTAYLQQLLDYERRTYRAAAIGIADAGGHWRAVSGEPRLLPAPAASDAPQAWRRGDHLVFVHPVTGSRQSDDPYLGEAWLASRLGSLTLVVSAEPIDALHREILFNSLAVLALILTAAGSLAWRLSNSLGLRLQRITQAVGRIADGDLAGRLEAEGGGEICRLEQGINRMADALAAHHTELEGRIREATAGLMQQKQAAEQAVRAKARFLEAASHDLRQPLHALSLLVAALGEQPLAPGTRRLVTHIEASTAALEDLFSALLDLSRLDAGVVEARPCCVALAEVMEKVRRQFAPVAEEKGLRLRIRSGRLHAQTDPLLLERILNNLVSNALRHTRSGGVLVGARRLGGGSRVRVEVVDTGIGIPQAHRDRIFEEYFQVGNPERDRDKGLGLGLSIVSRLSRLLGPERVQVQSAEGRGSRFSLVLERCAPAAGAAAQEPAALPLRRAVLAVIDDDETILEAMGELVSAWDLEIAVGADAGEVIAELQAVGRRPDAILCDYRLRTGMSGLAAIARVRATFGEATPAAVLTGDTAPETLRAIAASGLPLLHKPLRPAKLRALLGHLLRLAA